MSTDWPKKVIGRPADGEGDGDSAEEASNAASTGQNVCSATTAYNAAGWACIGAEVDVRPQLTNNHHKRTDDERRRNSKQQCEHRHAVRTTSPVPRPFLCTQ